MIIVLDTNVLVSGLLRPHGKPATILRLVATGLLCVAYDERIHAEPAIPATTPPEPATE